ncbi:MAG TPA: phosphotransferase [Acidimicrobiales bacterium]
MKVWDAVLDRVMPDPVARRLDFATHHRSARQGPPPGLDSDLVAGVSLQAFGRRPAAIRHAPLYSYKGGGVFRVWTDRSPHHTLVYKDARLAPEAFPAIAGLDGRPGLPEWDVLSSTGGALEGTHPAVYEAIEVEPGLHYRYVMEDLGWSYRQVTTRADVGAAIAALPALHTALARWASERGGYTEHVRCDSMAAPAILDHARRALEVFQQAQPDDVVGTVLAAWHDVEKATMSVTEASAVRSMLIHGDFNRGNLFLTRDAPVVLQAIDWEWMGVGPPHADLASILKWSPWAVQREEVRRFFVDDDSLGHDEHWRAYLWCRVVRSLQDAALHAAQTASGLGRTGGSVRTHLSLAMEHLAALDHVPVWPAGPPSVEATRSGRRRVSIVFPRDGDAGAGRATADAVHAQSHPDIEIVPVEAPSEASGLIVRAALEGSTGDFILWASPGDRYHPDLVARCVQSLTEIPGAVLAFPHIIEGDREGRFLADRLVDAVIRGPSPLKRFRQCLRSVHPDVPLSGVVRRTAVEASGLADRADVSPRALALALAVTGTFHEIPEILITRPSVRRVGAAGSARPGELVALFRRARLPVTRRAALVALTLIEPLLPGPLG